MNETYKQLLIFIINLYQRVLKIEKTCTLTLPFRSYKIYILPIKLYAMIEYFNHDLIFFLIRLEINTRVSQKVGWRKMREGTLKYYTFTGGGTLKADYIW